MSRESVLSLADKEAIQIERLIFHIILTNNSSPSYLDAVEITEDQKRFFKERLADAAQGRQYKFVDSSPTKEIARKIIDCSDKDFIELSKQLAASFKNTHKHNTNDGVFIISTASIRDRKLLFLVKLDHKKIYQYSISENKALLKEIQNTFSEDKTAIQKVALIDINERVSWDVLVYDRGARPEKGNITDYFRSFLGVIPRETETDLTKKAISVVREWATKNKSNLDEKQEVSYYKNRCKNYLLNHDQFDTNQFIEAVIQDEDSTRRETLKESLRAQMVESGLVDQEFVIKKNAIDKTISKNIRKTAEGVTIEWIGDMVDKNIIIPNTPDNNGKYVITITTSSITEVS